MGIRKHEDLVKPLFYRRYASGVFASYYIPYLLGQRKLRFIDDLPVLNHVYRRIVIQKAYYIKVEIIYGGFYLDDILFSHFF